MRRTLAIAWLIATFLPVAYLGYMILVFSHLSAPSGYEAERAQFERLFIIQFSMIVLSWGLVASYLVYLFKTQHVASDKRA